MSLSLNYESVHSFWYEFDRKIMYKIVCALEAAETWVYNDEEFKEYIVEFGYALQNNRSGSFRSEDDIIKLLANMSTPINLRVLQYLELAKSGYPSHLLNYAEAHKDIPENNFFFNRSLVFEKLQILSRIFGRDKIKILTKAVGEVYA